MVARYAETMDRDELVRVLRAFHASGLEYVLIGATAMGLHGLIRATEDLDVFIRPTAANVDRLKAALQSVYDDPQIEEIRAEDLLGDYPAVRYVPPGGDLSFDVLTRLGEAVTFESIDAQDIDVDGTAVRVATARALYRLKKSTLRPIDRQDAAALRGVRIERRGPGRVPVQKFRSIEAMNAAPAVANPDGAFARFVRHCARYRSISGARFTPGVFRFRTLAEAQAARAAETRKTIRSTAAGGSRKDDARDADQARSR
jgi:hypothetical protein